MLKVLKITPQSNNPPQDSWRRFDDIIAKAARLSQCSIHIKERDCALNYITDPDVAEGYIPCLKRRGGYSALGNRDEWGSEEVIITIPFNVG